MTSAEGRFAVFVLVSLFAFIAILYFVTRHRTQRPKPSTVVAVAGLVVVGGMLFAKFGNNIGLPWWIYYTVPALMTLAVPPVAFKFSGRELTQYLVLAFLSSPAIHVAFSFAALAYSAHCPLGPPTNNRRGFYSLLFRHFGLPPV